MLNLTEIATRIENPALSSVQDIEDLRVLCSTYPYSQVFPLLYLKTLSQTNDIRLDQEVQQFAYRISDRSILYQLLHEAESSISAAPDTLVAEVPEATAPISEEAITSEAEITSEQITAIVEEEITAVEAIEEEEPVPFNESEQEATVTETIEEIPEETAEEVHIPEKTVEADAFDQELRAQTMLSVYSIEMEEKKRLEEERERLIQALKSGPSRTEDEEPEETQPSGFEVPVSLDSKKSFSSWLRSNSHYTSTDPEEKPGVDSLIDRFIASEPKISAPEAKLFEDRNQKKDFFSPTKKAKESLDEGQLPVSETLAKIFAAQGNYPKAIYAYEQLMLIIPEKKIFFANQIKELQKKINP